MIWLAFAPFAVPALLLLWALSPFCIREAEDAGKTALSATYPRRSKWGNNPASQRVHEGGGCRLGALVTVAVQLAIGGLVAGGSESALIGGIVAQGAALLAIFVLTRRLIDTAEHGAECLHGDSHPLDPAAQLWLQNMNTANGGGFARYSDGEIWRATRPHEDFHGLTPEQLRAKFTRVRWLSRIIILLARW
jgi:hypothetical protein